MNIGANVAGNGFQLPFAAVENQNRARQVQDGNNAKRNAAAEASVKQALSVKQTESSVLSKNPDQSTAEVIAHLEKISLAFNKKLQFVVNHDSKQVTVNVIDANTDKVVKVLPPKELQRLTTKLKEDIGFLLDEKV